MTKLKNDRMIELPKGGELEVAYSDHFLALIRDHFGLETTPDDDHIRMFIYGAVASAIEKAESGDV